MRSTHKWPSFPTLNSISVFCFASVKASPSTRAVFTNIFGGGNGNEGLGLLALSFDWQYITSTFMSSVIFKGFVSWLALNKLLGSYPLIQQANSWIGYTLCYAAVAGIYYGNVWNVNSYLSLPLKHSLTMKHQSKNFPMISTSVFDMDGNVWNQTFVFGPTFQLNQTALDIEGLPRLSGELSLRRVRIIIHFIPSGSYVWLNMTASWSVRGTIAEFSLSTHLMSYCRLED